MYEAFYGLTEKPFNLTPDPRFLYLSEKHKEAFAHLVYGIKNRSGFVMISGEVGAGKTTICRGLLSQLDEAGGSSPDVELAIVFNPCLSPEELLRTINEDFGIASTAQTIKGLIDELNAFLLDRYANGKNCVLVIDEAQNLAPSVLEQVRMLSNLETETQKLLQIILIGQPELALHLQLPELRQLNQRITARYHLRTLSHAETLQYIAYRLRVAGGRRRVRFTRGAIRKIFRISEGTPRVINALCDRALLVGFTKEVRVITPKIVKQAHKELVGETFKPKRSWKAFLRPFLPSPAIVPTVAVILLAFLLGRWFFMPRYARWDDTATPGIPATSGLKPAENAAPEIVEAMPADSAKQAIPAPVPAPVTPPSDPKEPPVPVASVAPDLKPPALVPPPVMPPSAPAPAQPVTLADRIAATDPRDALKAGTAGIFRCWNRAPIAGYPEDTKADSIVAFVRANGMVVESLEPALDQLIALNLPALLSAKSGDKAIWVAVIGVENGKLKIIADASGPFLTPRDEFREVYQNQALVFWRGSGPAMRALTGNASGPEVVKLQRDLRQLARFQGKATGTYNEETARAIARIEAQTGMAVDGIAGRQVRMVLTAWAPNSGVPTLQPRPVSTPVVADTVADEKPEPKRKARDAKDTATPAPKMKPVAVPPKETPAPEPKPVAEPPKEAPAPEPKPVAEPPKEAPALEQPAEGVSGPQPVEKKDETPKLDAPPMPDKPAPEKQPEPAAARESQADPSSAASVEPNHKGNPQPPFVMGPTEPVPGYAVNKPVLHVEDLPALPRNDSLAPLKSDDSKEITPPLTGNTLLIPRQPSSDRG